VVLTHNRLAAPKANLLAGCTALAKLSLSHNALADLGGAGPLLGVAWWAVWWANVAELYDGGCNAFADLGLAHLLLRHRSWAGGVSRAGHLTDFQHGFHSVPDAESF